MRHRSKKKEQEYKLRRPLVTRLLEQRPYCEACPVFAEHDEKAIYSRQRSVDIHELKRRSQGGSILEEDNLMAVCRQCHNRIGNYPALAFELGLSRHGWEE